MAKGKKNNVKNRIRTDSEHKFDPMDELSSSKSNNLESDFLLKNSNQTDLHEKKADFDMSQEIIKKLDKKQDRNILNRIFNNIKDVKDVNVQSEKQKKKISFFDKVKNTISNVFHKTKNFVMSKGTGIIGGTVATVVAAIATSIVSPIIGITLGVLGAVSQISNRVKAIKQKHAKDVQLIETQKMLETYDKLLLTANMHSNGASKDLITSTRTMQHLKKMSDERIYDRVKPNEIKVRKAHNNYDMANWLVEAINGSVNLPSLGINGYMALDAYKEKGKIKKNINEINSHLQDHLSHHGNIIGLTNKSTPEEIYNRRQYFNSITNHFEEIEKAMNKLNDSDPNIDKKREEIIVKYVEADKGKIEKFNDKGMSTIQAVMKLFSFSAKKDDINHGVVQDPDNIKVMKKNNQLVNHNFSVQENPLFRSESPSLEILEKIVKDNNIRNDNGIIDTNNKDIHKGERNNHKEKTKPTAKKPSIER